MTWRGLLCRWRVVTDWGPLVSPILSWIFPTLFSRGWIDATLIRTHSTVLIITVTQRKIFSMTKLPRCIKSVVRNENCFFQQRQLPPWKPRCCTSMWYSFCKVDAEKFYCYSLYLFCTKIASVIHKVMDYLCVMIFVIKFYQESVCFLCYYCNDLPWNYKYLRNVFNLKETKSNDVICGNFIFYNI